jgi:hypothetical protein
MLRNLVQYVNVGVFIDCLFNVKDVHLQFIHKEYIIIQNYLYEFESTISINPKFTPKLTLRTNDVTSNALYGVHIPMILGLSIYPQFAWELSYT